MGLLKVLGKIAVIIEAVKTIVKAVTGKGEKKKAG